MRHVQRGLQAGNNSGKIGKKEVQWIWVEDTKIKQIKNDEDQYNDGKKASKEDDVSVNFS